MATQFVKDFNLHLIALPWAEKSVYIEGMIVLHFESIRKSSPDMASDELLSRLFEAYRPLIEVLDELTGDGNITGLDHAAFLMTFAPGRAADAARWLHENVTDDVAEQWWEFHPLLSVFHQLAQSDQSIAIN